MHGLILRTISPQPEERAGAIGASGEGDAVDESVDRLEKSFGPHTVLRCASELVQNFVTSSVGRHAIECPSARASGGCSVDQAVFPEQNVIGKGSIFRSRAEVMQYGIRGAVLIQPEESASVVGAFHERRSEKHPIRT